MTSRYSSTAAQGISMPQLDSTLRVHLSHDPDAAPADLDLGGAARDEARVLEGNQLRLQGQVVEQGEGVRVHLVESRLPVGLQEGQSVVRARALVLRRVPDHGLADLEHPVRVHRVRGLRLGGQEVGDDGVAHHVVALGHGVCDLDCIRPVHAHPLDEILPRAQVPVDHLLVAQADHDLADPAAVLLRF